MNKYGYDYGYSQKPPVLVDGESILWHSKPKKNAFIINRICTMMPFALLWLAFDSFFIVQLFSADTEILGFAVPFMLLHLLPVWIWLGNALTANKAWQNTMYYVTDRRILIQSGILAQEAQTIYYKDIRNVDMRIGLIDRVLGVGDIHFDLGHYVSNNKTRQLKQSFLDVENPDEVYRRVQKIVMDIQSDIHFPNAYRPEENPGYNTKYNG